MPPTANRADLLGPEWTHLYLAMLALGFLGFWVSAHLTKAYFNRNRAALATFFAVRLALASATLWATFQLLARLIFLATPWPLWLAATVSGGAVEIAISLYRHERDIVAERRSRVLIALRTTAILTLTLILLQPILARDSQRRLRREIAILLDDSASMQLADRQLTPSEKLKIATLFDVPGARRDQTLTDVQRGLQLLDSQLAAEARALAPPPGVSQAAANSLISRRTAPLAALFGDAIRRTATLRQILTATRASASEQTAKLLEDYQQRIANNITGSLGEAGANLADGNYPAASAEIQNIRRQISYILERLPDAIEDLDQQFYDSLSADARQKIDLAASTTRSAIARQTLDRGSDSGSSLVQQLGQEYQLRFIRFGQRAADMDGAAWLKTGDPTAITPAEEQEPTSAIDEISFRRNTDLTAALENILEKIPSGSLAGVLLLSDGRHNGPRPIDDVARRLGLQDAPICSVVIGSRIGPKDACILDVRVPEAIYLDDRAIIQADLKLDGLRGKTISVSLLKDGTTLETKEIPAPDQTYRTTARFAHTPDQIGISKYTIAASVTPGETFTENNQWDFQVAVTDDRTNVLIIDSFPRWEFRYLRNLFYARDKSVHLQFLLLNPDEITDTPPPPQVHASADRKFGDSEATALPLGREQWLKFDAIILGDIPPSAIDAATWDDIRYCISERATLLICIAGPRYMPHAFGDPLFKELLPVNYAVTTATQLNSPEPAYRLRLTPEGRAHPIMQQSLDPNLNEMVWGSLPPLLWRHAISGVKEGAEVLAYAHPLSSADAQSVPQTASATQFAAVRELQAKNALIAIHRYALGKVVMLNFDRTWRLRYGVGDVYHHKFWGQILRWGTGENLRAGNEFIRLGTDKLSYEPEEKIKVIAKVNEPDHKPLTDGAISASIYQRNQLVLRKQLAFRPDSNGIYEAEINPLPSGGRFRIRVDGDDASRILQSQGIEKVETEFIVERSRNVIELSELTADPGFLGRAAALSGGSIADPDNAAALTDFFGAPGQIIRERKETSLWDNFPLLLIFLALVTTEWITRRTSGLA